MSISFTKFLLKKKKKKKIKFISFLIIIFIFVLICIVAHVTNVFILKSATKDVLDDFRKNNVKVDYQIHSNLFTGDVVVKKLNFQIQDGNASVGFVNIKKTSGFFVPSEINVKIKDMTTTIARSDKNYIISQTGNEDGFYVKFNWGFFKKPYLSGMKNSSPAKYSIMDNEKVVGKINIDDFVVVINGDKKETKYKGSMMFHDTIFLPYVFLLDIPLSWDIHLQEFKTQDYIGLNKDSLVDLTNVKINKFFMDFDFAKLFAVGDLNYIPTRLNNINLKIDIDNDKKLIDNIFNVALRNKSDSMRQLKNFHNSIKKIIPILKKNNENSTNNHLQLIIKKTNIMPDYTINDIGLVELMSSVSELINRTN